jgi:hypothetical protein
MFTKLPVRVLVLGQKLNPLDNAACAHSIISFNVESDADMSSRIFMSVTIERCNVVDDTGGVSKLGSSEAPIPTHLVVRSFKIQLD